MTQVLTDLVGCLGDVPLDRIRWQPRPGTATVQDVVALRQQEGLLCELVEGVLLEKVMGHAESRLAGFLLGLLNAWVIPRNLGIVTGADGSVELRAALVRIPDVAFTSWDRLPGRRSPADPVPRLAPNLTVEILSPSNTPGEMGARRRDYFAVGVELVWEVDPDTRTVAVHTSAADRATLGTAETLHGAPALPGFSLRVSELFAELDRQG